MERSFQLLRGIKLSLTLIALVCTTIFVCTFDKSSFLSTLDRTGNDVVHSSSAPSLSIPSKSDFEVLVQEEGIPENALSNNSVKQIYGRDNRESEVTVAVGSIAAARQEIDSNAMGEVCSYARGRWIVDDNRPLYSGLGCKQWLSKMWACKLTQRTDFSYEKLRWMPQHCKMEDHSASNLLNTRIYNKTVAFIGDSLGRQQFQSLMCMLTGGEERPDVMDVGREYGLVKAPHAIRPDGWAYKFPATNTTVLYYWSASLCDLQKLDPTSPVTHYAMHLDRPPAFLKRFIHRFDIVVLNTGHHWNRGKIEGNGWVMHVGGVPSILEIGSAKNLTIHSIVQWGDSELRKRRNLDVFYRTISPRHYVHGDWNTGGSCNNTVPVSVGKEVPEDQSLDPIPFLAARGTNVKLLDITALSGVRDEGHVSHYGTKKISEVQDCLHWCLPGIPDTWNELLLAQL